MTETRHLVNPIDFVISEVPPPSDGIMRCETTYETFDPTFPNYIYRFTMSNEVLYREPSIIDHMRARLARRINTENP